MYDKYCVNKYFVGEIGRRIAGHVWYGYASRGAGIANFGEVYTEPEHRKKGIIGELMKVFKENFGNSPAKAALCTAGAGWVAGIYAKSGFQTVIPGVERGPLILIRKGCGKDFEEFERAYYAPGQEVSVTLGSMKHRHDIDTLLRFSTILRRGRESGDPMKYVSASGATLARRVGMAHPVTNYMDAVFKTEDGRGIVTVAVTKAEHVVGWAFFLNTGSEFEAEGKVFDFELHPSYAGSGPLLIRESLRLAREHGIAKAYAYCPAVAEEKIKLLAAERFSELARFRGHCRFGPEVCDLVVLGLT
jgi:GNAT superfamily N-acetyltransferase